MGHSLGYIEDGTPPVERIMCNYSVKIKMFGILTIICILRFDLGRDELGPSKRQSLTSPTPLEVIEV